MFKAKRAKGFTLTELLVASTVFSSVALAMGMFLVFAARTTHEGEATAELQRKAYFIEGVLGRTLAGVMEIKVPAYGEPAGDTSFTAIFPPEPFVDENRNGRWDASGARGPCQPQECFYDVNNNTIWDNQFQPPISFRLNGHALERKEGDGQWINLLDPEEGESTKSHIAIEDFRILNPEPQDNGLWMVRVVLRDDRGTPGEPDDLRRTVEILAREKR